MCPVTMSPEWSGVKISWGGSLIQSGWTREGQRGAGQLPERGGEFFPHSGNESTVGVDDQHGEAALADNAQGAALGVECESGHLAEPELGGGVLHGIEHFRRSRAHRNKVETLGDIVSGDDEIAVSEDAGADAGERAADLDDAADGEFFFGEEEGLEGVLIGKIGAVAAGLDFEQKGCGFRGREAVESRKPLDEFEEAVRLVGRSVGIGLGSGFRGDGLDGDGLGMRFFRRRVAGLRGEPGKVANRGGEMGGRRV